MFKLAPTAAPRLAGPLAAALLVAGLATAPARAAEAAPQRLITTTGSGEVSAAPDQAELGAGVVSEAKTAKAALADNNDKMNAVFAALKKLGVKDKNIRTSGFSVSPQYPNYNSQEERHITGYQVSNTVHVILENTDRLGAVLDALVSAGANQINSVEYSIADPAPLLAKARTAAVKAATAEAQTYAKAAGVSLGPIQSINEGGDNSGPRPMVRMMASAAKVPTAPGQQSVSASVTISWQIQ